jgi:hypothetical protein
MKNLFLSLFVFGLISCSPARADRVDDLNAFDMISYCQATAQMYHGGADSNATGFARVIRQMPVEFVVEYLEHMLPLPKDAMWIMQWDQLKDREKAFMTKIVFEGWDKVQEIKDSGVKVPDDYVNQITETYFNRCLEIKSSEATYKKTASSQRIIEPHGSNTIQQEYCTTAAVTVYNRCMIGQ